MASSTGKRNSKIQHTVIETAPKATLLMLLAGLFILLIGTLIIQNSDSPVALSSALACLALYFGAAVGGCFCAARLNERRMFGCSLTSSSLLCVILIIAKAFVAAPETTKGFAISLICHLLVPACAVLGAVICNHVKTNKEIKNRKAHYRRKK